MKMSGSSKFVFKLPALRVLEKEHHLLRHLMAEWHEIVLNFDHDKYNEEEARVALMTLKKKMIAFIETLQTHTDKEEEYLIRALAKYVGDEQGPVPATQDEQQEIDAYVGHFLHHIRGAISEFRLQ